MSRKRRMMPALVDADTTFLKYNKITWQSSISRCCAVKLMFDSAFIRTKELERSVIAC
jgi:hypothetical protein